MILFFSHKFPSLKTRQLKYKPIEGYDLIATVCTGILKPGIAFVTHYTEPNENQWQWFPFEILSSCLRSVFSFVFDTCMFIVAVT